MTDSGASDQLVEAFRTVAEASGSDGPRYGPRTLQQLAQAVAGRAYARPMLELCHLIRIADRAARRGGYPSFFWSVLDARGSAFHGICAKAADRGALARPDFTLDDVGVTACYADGPFTVRYGRMPFLAAVLEFLITTLGFTAVDELAQELLSDRFDNGSAGEHANRLSRRVYEYLRDHLPTVQQQRKFRMLIDYMIARAGRGFTLTEVDDAAVLEFWLNLCDGGDEEENADRQAGGADVRTYRSAVNAFLRLRQSIRVALERRALASTRRLGADREAGDVDPDALETALETIEANKGPLAMLQEPPADRVKFLNKREIAGVELMAEAGPDAQALPLSILRGEVFGAHQARLTQASRSSDAGNAIARIVDKGPNEDYGDQIARWREVDSHLGRCRLAGIHALSLVNHPALATALLDLEPTLDLTVLAPKAAAVANGGNLVAFPAADQAARLLVHALSDSSIAGADLARIGTDARRAYKAIARQGFRESDLQDDETVEAFARTVSHLRDMRLMLTRYLTALDSTLSTPDGGEDFSCDGGKFAKAFHSLYGGSA